MGSVKEDPRAGARSFPLSRAGAFERNRDEHQSQRHVGDRSSAGSCFNLVRRRARGHAASIEDGHLLRPASR